MRIGSMVGPGLIRPVPADPALDLKQLQLDDPEWLRFVRGHPGSGPFHDPAWAMLLAETYGLSGFVLVQEDEAGSIRAGVPLLSPRQLPRRPRRLISLPFTDNLDPLVEPTAAAGLVDALEAARRELGVARIELRGALEGAHASQSHAVLHTLALGSDPDAILAACSKTKRRDVRAFERRELSIERATSARDLTETYFRLHLDTRRRLGVPSQPKRFFRLLWDRIIEPGHGFVLLVHEGRTPVAGGVFLTGNRTVVYKYSGSDAKHRAQRPNVLLLWSAILQGCEQGFTLFDFGRSERSAAGLRAFKSEWGAVEEPLVYSVIGEHGSDEAGTPGVVATILRRSPTWVTRVTGELLYRFAA